MTMTTQQVIQFLLKNEWGMGNGQCQECHGLSPFRWSAIKAEERGHYGWCELAQAVEALGGSVLYSTKEGRG